MNKSVASHERDWCGWLPLLLPLVGFYGPVMVWFVQSLQVENESSFSGIGTGAVFLRTLGVAGGAAMVAGVVGTCEALLWSTYARRLRSLLGALLLLPFLLPPAVLTTAAHALFAGGPLGFLTDGVSGAIALSSWQMTPVVFWGVARALATRPLSERWAVENALSPGRALWGVTRPRVMPVSMCMTLVVLLLLMPAREIAGYTGVETAGDRVLAAFSAVRSEREGWGLVGALSTLMLPLLVLVGWLGKRRLPSSPPGGSDEVRPRLDRRATMGGRLIVGLLWGLALSWTVPLALLFSRAAGHSVETAEIWAVGLASESFRCLLLAVVVAILGWRLALQRAAWIGVACVIPLFLPGSLSALALLETTQHFFPAWLIDQPVLLSVAQAARYLAVGFFFGKLALDAIPRPERDAALALPMSRRRWLILFPRSVPMLAVSALFLWVLFLGEVEATSLLIPPGSVSPIVELHQFLHFRHDAQAAQLAVSITGVGLLVAATLVPLGRVLFSGQSSTRSPSR